VAQHQDSIAIVSLSSCFLICGRHVCYAACIFKLLLSCILLMAFSVFWQQREFSWSVYEWLLIQYAFPKLVLNPQAMSSLLFFLQSILCLDFYKARILKNVFSYAFIAVSHFFLRHVGSVWIIRINISDMFWAWEILTMSSPGNLLITSSTSPEFLSSYKIINAFCFKLLNCG